MLFGLALLAVAVLAGWLADRVPRPQRRWRNAYPQLVSATAILCLVADLVLLGRYDATTAVMLTTAALLLAVAARRRSRSSERQTRNLRERLRQLTVARRSLRR